MSDSRSSMWLQGRWKWGKPGDIGCSEETQAYPINTLVNRKVGAHCLLFWYKDTFTTSHLQWKTEGIGGLWIKRPYNSLSKRDHWRIKRGIISNYTRNRITNQNIPQLSMGSYTKRNVSQRLPEAETVARILGKDLRVKSKVKIMKSVVLDLGRFWSPRNTWQCLKTFSLVAT